MEEKAQKRLTVTFHDVEVVVHGLGEDYGPTCTSVVADLIPCINGHKSQRVSIFKRTMEYCLNADETADNTKQDLRTGSPRGNGKPNQ